MGLSIDIAWLTLLLFGSLAILLALGLPMAFCTGSLAVIFLYVFGNSAIFGVTPAEVPLWYGVIFIVNMQMAFLSPPFGYSLFYLKSVAPPEISMATIFRSAQSRSVCRSIPPTRAASSRDDPSSTVMIASNRRACPASFARCASRRTSPLV